MSVRIKEDSDLMRKIEEVEVLMSKYGLKIVGNNLHIEVKGRQFRIGRDADEFPRYIDEPLVCY